jgi:glycosyltransferase involved in cell wall biosynthesis
MEKLLEGGLEVHFVSFLDKSPKLPLPSGVYYEPINISFHRGKKLDRTIKNALFLMLIPFIIFKLHLKNRFDLIYCDDSFPLYGLFIKKMVRTKVLVRLADLMVGYVVGSPIKSLIFKILFQIEGKTWEKADGVIANSEAFRKFLIGCGIPKAKIYLVEECVDAEIFNKTVSGEKIRSKYGINGSPLVMNHGILAPFKGIETLIKSIPLVLRHVPNVKFIIIGSGPSLAGLKLLSKQLHIHHSVIFTGWVPYETISEYLAACDIGVVQRTGDYANNFIITSALLQYWAVGKPVIAPRLLAISQIVKDGENGLLFNPGDPDDLAKKLVWLLNNIDEDKKMGRHGLLLAKNQFNSQLIGTKLAEALMSNLSVMHK